MSTVPSAATLVVALLLARGGDPPDGVTFSEHVAPIVFRSCVPCHREGESGPFPLLSYEDVARRAGQIAEVTASRYMPPWMPPPGHIAFVGDRSLTDEEIATFRRWIEAGKPAGDPALLPEVPPATGGWYLGEPDLVVTMAEPYVVPAEGVDVYRNFVIPIPVDGTRYVEALDLHPGNKRVAHHGVLRIDRTRASRELDAQDDEPGFPGLDLAQTESPDGHVLGWTPGRVPLRSPAGKAWTLEPDTDLIVQLHMVPSGKPEPIQPALGFYFTDQPPTTRMMVLTLRNDDIDIPAGERAYVAEDSLTLVADVTLTRIGPHAHYLGKRCEAFAVAPDGTRTDLLLIEDWDFNWQDVYEYVEPIRLAKGSRVTMRWTFDNSAGNPRNPQVPPQRVTVGNRSQDEMATLSLQLEIASGADRRALMESEWRHRIERNPENWVSRLNLGAMLARSGRFQEAAEHLRAGLAYQPSNVELLTNLGAVLASLGQMDEARRHLETALRLSPAHPGLRLNLARVEEFESHWEAAADHYRAAIASSPRDAAPQRGLGGVMVRLQRLPEAAAAYALARTLDPTDHASCYQLGRISFRLGNLPQATDAFLAGLAIHPLPEAHEDLARVYRARGMQAEAREQAEAARRLSASQRSK